jgi:cysteine desulfuration protein SufE
MNIIQHRQQKIVQDFSQLTQWEDRYKKIIEMGKSLPNMPEELKTEQNIVKGCQSQVWLSASLNEQGGMV